MADLIDREALISEIGKVMLSCLNHDIALGIHCALNIIEKIPSANEWISVEKEFPPLRDAYTKCSEDVIVTDEYNIVSTAYYDYVDEKWYDMHDYEFEDAQAWMPYPKPFTGELK